MRTFFTIFLNLFLLTFYLPLNSQTISSDSLRKQILNQNVYTPHVDDLLDLLDYTEVDNVNFLIHNIGMISEDFGDIILPIMGYLIEHPQLISMDNFTKELLTNSADFHLFLDVLDYKFDNHVSYMKYLDLLLCNNSFTDEQVKEIKDKRYVIYHKQKALRPHIHESDYFFMLFELKPNTDSHNFKCLLKELFPFYYENAYKLVDFTVSDGHDLICVPFENGQVINKEPFTEFLIEMKEIDYCLFRQLIKDYLN